MAKTLQQLKTQKLNLIIFKEFRNQFFSRRLVLVFLLVTASHFLIGQPVLLKGPEIGTGITPYILTKVGSQVFFGFGNNLWKTDGTSAGTVLVKALPSNPQFVGNFNDQLLYFRIGNNLWRSDGTDSGTILLADIQLLFNSIPSNTAIAFLGSTTTKFFFNVSSGGGGTMGFSDGTPAGTVNTNQFGNGPSLGIGNKLFYRLNTASDELYVTDGSTFTQIRAFPLMPFGVGTTPTIGRFNEYNGKLIFGVYSGIIGSGGVQLWISDGTAANTNFLINPVNLSNPTIAEHGPDLLYSGNYKIGSKIYFNRAFNATSGQEPFIYDGANVSLLKDIAPGNASSGMNNFYDGGSLAYSFRADLIGNLELWKSDGAEIGTSLVKTLSINTNSGGLQYNYIPFGKPFNSSFIFTRDQTPESGLWRSDGTAAGTGRIALTNISSEFFIVGSNILYMQGNSLFAIDGQTKFYQEITFNGPNSQPYGSPNFILTGTASSGLPITYTSSNANVATISGNTVNIVGVGSTTITATQVGDAIFAAATPVQRSFSVQKASQTITFGSLSSKTFGDPAFNLSATATSGLSVSYTSSNGSVATISGSTLNIVGAGTATITASQAGNTNYFAASSVQQTLTVNKASQTITFGTLPLKGFGDPPFGLTATTTSGLPISYSSSNTSVATVSSSTVTIVGIGSTNITASQPGNTNYNAATNVIQPLTIVGKSDQTITFAPLPVKTYNNAPFVLTATSSSGLPVTYVSSNSAVASINGNIVTIEGAGTCTITAKQPGDANYNPAPDVQQTFTVNKSAQSLVANFLGTPRLTTDGPFNPQAYYSSGLPATISSSNTAVATVSGNLITPVSAGVTTLTVSQPGDNNFLPATNSTFTLTVNNPTQSPYKFTLQGGNPVSQLSFPLSNLEVDASGKIYAINPSQAQIIILNPDGSFNKSFGSFGTKDGELNNPSDVAVDGSGNMYVVDAGNNRIQVFDSNGTFIRKFGSIGVASGNLSTPNSIALDGNGNVFIVERMGRVSVFTTNGIWQRSFGSTGSGPGQLSVPRGIDLDTSGNAYVVDAGNGRVVVYASNGTYLRTIGTNGSANGQLDGPKYVKLDGAGNVIVTNDFNARVEVFANNGNFLANFPWPGGSTGACGIARDGSGNIYISNYNTNELLKFSPTGTLLQTIMPLPQTTLQVFQPSGVAFDGPGNVYVASASKNVRVFTSNGTYIRTIGAPGTADGQFKSGPGKIAVDASGNTYVADIGNSRVQVFDNTGAFVRKVGVGLLGSAVGLAIDASGNIYVTDPSNNKIQVFQNNGTFITSFGTAGTGNGQFASPAGVAVDGSGNIYVADGGNNRIQVFTNSGTFIRTFGTAGGSNGEFNLPYDIKLDGAGNIYVADRNNHRVQVFKNDGTFLCNVGSLGYGSLAGNGHLYAPVSLAVNPSGLTIGVADYNNNLIQAFGSPDINLKQTGSIVSNGNYNFGNINMLSSSSVTQFTVENLGSAALNLTGNPKVSLSGANASDFTVNSSGTTAAIQPGGSTTFTVTFTPSAVGTRVAQLSIVSDDLDETPYLINLTGTGVKLNQTITFNTLATKAFGDPVFNLTATASSALAVTYASSNPLVATVSGNTVTIVGVGTTSIIASQAGNGNYNAAANVLQTLTVNKANQVINFSAIAAKTFNDPDFTLTGTASSLLSVTYTSSNTSVATISGNMVTVIGAGTSVITASQAGNANYNAAAPVPQTLTVNKANQTITFASLSPFSIGDSPFNLNATSSSGLTVTYSSSNIAVATISGNTVTIVGLGTTTITAIQSGNGNYNAATSVDQILTVKQAQSISFAALPAKTYGDAPFTISATSSSTLPVSFSSSNGAVATISGNTVTIVGAGVTTITAGQAGNITFNAAPDATQLLTVDKAAQIITFGALSDKTFGDASFALTGSASSSLSVAYTTSSDKVTISGNQVTIVKPGRATITANQAGNSNFNAANQVDQSFCINPSKPTISITNENTESPTLTSSSPSGNQWYLNGSSIAGATNATFNIASAGVYKVQVKADDCISEFSADFPIIVTGDLPKRVMAVTVSPNPVDDVLEIRGIDGEIKSFQLVDLTGRTASFEIERNPSSYSASVKHLAQGMYILRVQVTSELHQIKFIKK